MADLDRIERAIEGLRLEVGALGKAMAGMVERVNTAKQTAVEVDALDDKLASHETADAATHAELRTDVRRIWWGIGIVMTGVIATLVSVLTKTSV